MGYLASDSYFSLKNVCWRLLIYLIILIVLVNEMKKIAMNESVYVQNVYRFFSFRNTTITMSMKWKINDIRISSWVILIIFAWFARKYVLYLYFIYIAIILYLMWEYNCKISAFHGPRAHIPIIWLWGQSGELEGSEFRCYVTMITMLNTLLPLRTPSTLPIRHMVYS